MPGGHLDAGMLGEHGGVLADQVLVDVRLAVVAALERGLRERLDLAGGQPVAAVPGHRLGQRVEDLGHGEDLLLADAEQVVVERPADDDRLGRVVQAGGGVDDDRRIARPGDDRPPLAGQRGPGDGRAAGHDQQADRLVVEQLRRPSSSVGGSMIVSRLSRPIASRIALLNRRTPSAAIFAPGGMGVEDDRVARGQHVDRVGRQGRQAVGDRRDRADDAERGVVGQGQAVVAGGVVGPQVLDARDQRDRRRAAWRSCGRAGRSWSPRARAGPAPRPGRRRSSGCTRRPSCGRRARGVRNCSNAASAASTASSTVGKTPRFPGRPGVRLAVGRDGPVAHLGEDLLDHVADEIFGHLHGGTVAMKALVGFSGR